MAGRLKRQLAGSAKAVRQVEEAVQQVAEERRLYGKPLSEATDLFVEDRSGQQAISSRLGIAKAERQLTIDKILKPASRTQVAPQRQRPSRSKPSSKTRTVSRPPAPKEADAYDMWQSDKAACQPTAKPSTPSLEPLSYRPEITRHLEVLCELEAREEVKEEARMARTQPVPERAVADQVMTMEERADMALLHPDSDSEPESHGAAPSAHVASKKKTQVARNREVRHRLELLDARRRKERRQQSNEVNLAPFYRRQLDSEAEAADALAQAVKSSARRAEPDDILPLLPDQVPASLLALPATHSNPLHECFARITAAGRVEPRARPRQRTGRRTKDVEKHDHRSFAMPACAALE